MDHYSAEAEYGRSLKAAVRAARLEHVSMVKQYGADSPEAAPYAEALARALDAWNEYANAFRNGEGN